eukprot:TRINITY_DN55026_c0_g1_i2.p1 TRINITY_DN55026_c0_g1~~TRINITY_DN55026_c0_g1_i2.p1  ORF type:complete len:254 (-),score=83.97 TRINITY_DN55026_c0_g1_i2:95-856(-)
MFQMLLSSLSFILSLNFVLCVLLFSYIMYLLLNTIVPTLLGPQDLKKKYNAKWALITGSSSGIGKELARKCLYQEMDVILIAREEPLFDQAVADFKEIFPSRQVVQINANLSDESGAWMAMVKEQTADKDVQVNFLNAGFILTGMFEQNKVEAHMANLHCNLTSNIWLSHHLYSELLRKQLGGCIVFTSSSASYLPNPFAALYATTKAGISAFACLLYTSDAADEEDSVDLGGRRIIKKKKKKVYNIKEHIIP